MSRNLHKDLSYSILDAIHDKKRIQNLIDFIDNNKDNLIVKLNDLKKYKSKIKFVEKRINSLNPSIDEINNDIRSRFNNLVPPSNNIDERIKLSYILLDNLNDPIIEGIFRDNLNELVSEKENSFEILNILKAPINARKEKIKARNTIIRAKIADHHSEKLSNDVSHHLASFVVGGKKTLKKLKKLNKKDKSIVKKISIHKSKSLKKLTRKQKALIGNKSLKDICLEAKRKNHKFKNKGANDFCNIILK